MAYRKHLSKSSQTKPLEGAGKGPIMKDSVLYRLLQLIARQIAKELTDKQVPDKAPPDD
jgi:hypothetical protein